MIANAPETPVQRSTGSFANELQEKPRLHTTPSEGYGWGSVACDQDSVGMPRFVIQEHYARTHHFDFRLEKGGVLKSWAVPKGLPEQPGIKRLCIQVEDHDASFGAFEGEIPEGDYGAGQITVWDHGDYEAGEWADDLITFTLHGNRLSGEFHLLRFKHGKPGEWLIFMSRPVPQTS